jgi:GTPase SAR1 family protein
LCLLFLVICKFLNYLAEGFNIENVKYENINFQMWDVGGQSSIRRYWKGYYPKTKAVVFVIDSNDRDRINIVKEELFLLLQVLI